MAGYIKLHRQLLDSIQFSNPNLLKMWIWILLKAVHKTQPISIKVSSGYTTVNLERGQFVFGRDKAEQALKLTGSMIYRFLKVLEKDGSIIVKSNNKYSIITVCKYDDYNKIIEEDEQPVNSQRTASEQPVNTYKKDKKVDKVKEENIYSAFTFFNNGFEKHWDDFKELRVKLKKPLIQSSEILNLKKLSKLSGDNKQKAILILEQTLEHGWQGFFPLKDSDAGKNELGKEIYIPNTKPNRQNA